MISIRELYGPATGEPEDTAKRQMRLAEAYEALFGGRGSKEDAEIVLTDLAFESGFFFVDDGGATDAQLRHDSGRRFLFGRIARLMNLSPAEIAALQRAMSFMLQDE
jgi:hypothetical protein